MATAPETPPGSSAMEAAATSVIGKSVVDADGADVGQVVDLTVDLVHGRINAIEIGVGGVLGLGADRYNVPWTSVVYNHTLDAFVLANARKFLPSQAGAATPLALSAEGGFAAASLGVNQNLKLW